MESNRREEVDKRFLISPVFKSVKRKEEKKIEAELRSPAVNAIMDAKYGFIAGALKETFEPVEVDPNVFTPTTRIDKIVTNKYLAYPIFALIIYLMVLRFFGSWIYDLERPHFANNNLLPDEKEEKFDSALS